jgi:hypothetical protein
VISKTKTTVEYQTIQVGTALLAHALLKELRVANAIDAAINSIRCCLKITY